MKEIILDTETTGLSVKDGHRVVEIGCIELDNLIPTSKKFHCYLNPERKVSEKAFEVHGYTDEFLSTKKKFKEVADDFINFINNKIIVLDIPLLLENKLNKKNYILIFVKARKSKIMKNLIKRKNYNPQILKVLKKFQLPLELKRKKSNYIINNNFRKLYVKKNIKIIKNKILNK